MRSRHLFYWSLFIFLSLSSLFIVTQKFFDIFPITQLAISMNRDHAITSAHKLAQKSVWTIKGYHSTASFDLDQDSQHYIELASGGHSVFKKIINEHLYEPYTWTVRHYKEQTSIERYYSFTPSGKPYGFYIHVPETVQGPSLSSPEARALAESQAQFQYNTSLQDYTLIESTQKVQTSDRTDHTFVYEHKTAKFISSLSNKTEPNTPEHASIRLQLKVSGAHLSELTHSLKIPDSFYQHYEHIRSFNQTLSNLAFLVTLILYFFIIGGYSLRTFLKSRWFILKPSMLWAILISSLLLAHHFNTIPLLWMDYDTALSSRMFILNAFISAFYQTIIYGLFLTGIFILAEAVTRKAFPNHIQFWKIWTPPTANSLPIIKQTLIGYLCTPFLLGFVVLFYSVTFKYFNWWLPSSTLSNPNILAHFFPWLSPLISALNAGFMEEFVFRALPLGTAMILGKKFNRPRLFLIFGFLIQALIFSSAHANYPTQPYYARLIELMVPSLIFGGLYLRFGLLTAILTHFSFDALLGALPLLLTQDSQRWINLSMFTIFFLTPFWVLLSKAIINKRIHATAMHVLNKTFKPLKRAPLKLKFSKPTPKSQPYLLTLFFFLTCSLTVGLWLWFMPILPDMSQQQISRSEALEIAKDYLIKKDIPIQEKIATCTLSIDIPKTYQFVWEMGGRPLFEKLIDSYIQNPYWLVRFASFSGSMQERAEEYHVYINHKGRIFRSSHQLPETAPSPSLTSHQALSLSQSMLYVHQLKEEDVTLNEQEPSKLPNRLDWTLTYALKNNPVPQGEAYTIIAISGNKITDHAQRLHIPETWLRAKQSSTIQLSLVKKTTKLILLCLFILGTLTGLFFWTKKIFCYRTFTWMACVLILIKSILLITNWPRVVMWFSPFKPLSHQLFSGFSLSLVSLIATSLSIAIILGCVHGMRWYVYKISHRTVLVQGVCIGLIMTCVWSLITAFEPKLVPLFATTAAASHILPPIIPTLTLLGQWLFHTTIILLVLTCLAFITRNWSKRHWMIPTTFFILFLLLYDVNHIQHLSFWLIKAGVMACIFTLMTQILFRYSLSAIPYATAMIFVLTAFQQTLFNAYPTAQFGNGLAIIVILISSYFWARFLRTRSGYLNLK